MESKVRNSFCNIKLITGIKTKYGQNIYIQNMKAVQDTYFRRLYCTVFYDTEYRRTTCESSINNKFCFRIFTF